MKRSSKIQANASWPMQPSTTTGR